MTMKFEVSVEGEGLTDVEIIDLPEGGTGRDIVIAVAERDGFSPDEAILLVEDSGEMIDILLPLTEAAVGKVHHVHRAREIEVSVYYNGHDKRHKFPPSARIQRVLDWAVGPEGFNVDKTIAPEMELALHGQETPLPKNAHIGRYVRHPHHQLVLDLIRGIIPNGACP